MTLEKLLKKAGKISLVALLSTQLLTPLAPQHVFADDDDDYEEVEDWDDDDYEDYDDYDDDEADDDWQAPAANQYGTPQLNDDWDDDDDQAENWDSQDLDDDDDDDQDGSYYVTINNRQVKVDSDDDWEDIWETYYESVGEDDDKAATPSSQETNKIAKVFHNVELKQNPNFMTEKVTKEDDPSQGFKPGDQLANKDIVEKVEIKTDKPIPTLAQDKKDKQKKQQIDQRAKDKTAANQLVVKDQKQTSKQIPVKANQKTQQDVNQNVYIDEKVLNQEFLALLNKDRQAKGLKPVAHGTHLQEGVNKRSQDLSKIGHIRVNDQAHVRLDGSSFREDFNYLGGQHKNALGENTAMTTYSGNPNQLLSEKALAEQFYQQWKNSPGHYDNMMSPNYNYSTISVKMSDKNALVGDQYNALIAVQVLDSSVK
ncbi:hypothetical protein AWM75_04655 [Aerococcus urinaehominis]|uniref:Uncharacterized protein n=1 Tax=Aerococcus urinaehominis TaxID=128944 RepID=A0A0X8FL46_9LACT|nr:CAP domain-containing protein [Aerococcus urinaehominis]AMB99333.1 hypothetical protein AWM75_04655 [Aerococcus urinaehominis]SDM20813.1 Cysteine-rich secretory protein family protein [Aerococcus urinaehominis]